MQHGYAKFWFFELNETCTFRELNTGNLRPLQQFGIFFVYYRIGFVWIADFFCILYAFLKKLHLYEIDRTYPLEPILQNLSSRTYPLEPILQYLSSSRFCVGTSHFWSAVEEMDCMRMNRFLSFFLYFIFLEIIFIGFKLVWHNFH